MAKFTRNKLQKTTAIDKLAQSIGPKLRKEFPTSEDFDAYLRANRKKIFKKFYGENDTKSSD